MYKPFRFKGTGVAIITPFKTDFSIDYPALAKVIEHVIEGGVDFIVSLGTTGEFTSLTEEEALSVLQFTAEKINNRCPLVAGCFGGNNTTALVTRIQQFDFAGIDAIMSSSPSYNKPTQEGLYQHYMALEAVSPLPIIIYNVPSRTGANIAPATVARLAKASKKFIAVKDAKGSMQQFTDLVQQTPDDFLVLCGDDPLILPAMSIGAAGGISVIANALPKQFSALINAVQNNDWTLAQKHNLDLWNIHHWLYKEGNPAGIKAATALLQLTTKNLRLPLVPLSEKATKNLSQSMAAFL